MMLALRDVSSGYGPVTVLRHVSFALAEGEILGIVGHNGMGKTTLLRTLMGLLKTASGTIELGGQSIETEPAHERSRRGIGYVPQGEQGFPTLTVAENLQLAVAMNPPGRPLTMDDVLALFPRLRPLLDRRSGALSGGERQLLAIARAVMRAPRLLLLDEMTEGVQPSIVEEIAERLVALHAELSMSLLIVDQDLAFVAALASRALVMQKGMLVKEVSSTELIQSNVLGGFDAL
ncbi:ABC transporter ATP-binding protein [Dongia sedimenti]|uniref:ABC transporter ATP-binding protein n=1 Tax=Dongia sedimenti TaxID=3064282 RepID=A0ABU0YRW0_9PROT|nr:ABC transporter ATP-binding protein [Rhodospirillaceae bacterium R-7]